MNLTLGNLWKQSIKSYRKRHTHRMLNPHFTLWIVEALFLKYEFAFQRRIYIWSYVRLLSMIIFVFFFKVLQSSAAKYFFFHRKKSCCPSNVLNEMKWKEIHGMNEIIRDNLHCIEQCRGSEIVKGRWKICVGCK